VVVDCEVGFARCFTFIPFQSICIICASFVSELGHECSGILRFLDTKFLEYGWTARRSVLRRGEVGWVLDSGFEVGVGHMRSWFNRVSSGLGHDLDQRKLKITTRNIGPSNQMTFEFETHKDLRTAGSKRLDTCRTFQCRYFMYKRD